MKLEAEEEEVVVFSMRWRVNNLTELNLIKMAHKHPPTHNLIKMHQNSLLGSVSNQLLLLKIIFYRSFNISLSFQNTDMLKSIL